MQRQSSETQQQSSDHRFKRVVESVQHTLTEMPTRVFGLLREPVDVASLVFFRIAFGAIMLWEVVRYFQYDRITRYYVEPKFLFKYYGFEWVHPWPGEGMNWHFAALGLLALLITIGCCYRLATLLFFLGFTYVFLLDQANHLNHFYLISLISFLLILIPAHAGGSVDAWLRPRLRRRFVPGWSLRILQAQIAIVYFFGGVAKLNSDWLNCRPVANWVARRTDLPLIGPWLAEPAAGWIVAYGGLIFDLAVAPLLCWRKTRPYAFVVAVLFHLSNSQLFNIGIFPWFMIAATAMFFPADWPRRFLPRRFGGHRLVVVSAPLSRWQRAGIAFTIVYLTLQTIIPLRHFIYPGNTNWNELGHRFAWHMKLRSKRGKVGFIVTNPATGKSWWHRADRTLNDRQMRKMSGRPDMLLQFAHHIRGEYQRQGLGEVEVCVESWISLNGHDYRRLIDPTVNLAVQPRTLGVPAWIVPFDAQWNPGWPSIGRLFTRHRDELSIASNDRAVETTERRSAESSATEYVSTIDRRQAAAGTAKQRIALFDDLLEKTLAREAFSPVKDARLGIDFERDAIPLRDKFAQAETDKELFRAIVRFSNLRKNAHLKVGSPYRRQQDKDRLCLPIRFLPDYSDNEYPVFVSDISLDLVESMSQIAADVVLPEVGDRIVAIDGLDVASHQELMAPNLRYSTRDWLKWKYAAELSVNHPEFGSAFSEEQLRLTLLRADGLRYDTRLPFVLASSVRWSRPADETEQLGYRRVLETESFDLQRPLSTEHPELLLKWRGFGPSLVGDVDRLMQYARQHNLLDHDVICDMTVSGGGQRAWYLLQRLVSRPFKVTYGNLRISDLTNRLARNLVENGMSSSRLNDWFETDVRRAQRDDLEYTQPVPFKLRALPADSDGMLVPADLHFRGRTVCLFGPEGVSQVDQFAAMFIDNQLGHSIGMPTRGSSNTWEWRESVYLPGAEHPIASMKWSLGNVLRPNGEILEGNPPQPAEYIPLTRKNHQHYREELLNHARGWLRQTSTDRQAAVENDDNSL